MKEKHKLQHTDWRERLEALRHDINVPLDIEPDLLQKKDDTDLSLSQLAMEEQNGIL